jgi:hypothetical protein
MLSLRADPWTPDHGMGFEAVGEETPATADPLVETAAWGDPIRPQASEPGTLWFVDGVRRGEIRLVADDDGKRAPGLFGSYAVGAVRCDGRASSPTTRSAVGVLAGGMRLAASGPLGR